MTRKADHATHTNRSSRKHFEGEQFLESYLTPKGPGCKFHLNPDCLCDVDISCTAEMTWDQAPDCLVNVDTAEDLVLAGANVWLNYDLTRPYVQLSESLDDVKMQQLIDMARDMRTTEEIEAALNVRIEPHTMGLIREALNAFRPNNRNRPLPVDAICKLHTEGFTARMIFERLRDEMDWHPSLGMIYRVLRGNGFKPHNGKPKGFDSKQGLTYSEWREKYGLEAAS